MKYLKYKVVNLLLKNLLMVSTSFFILGLFLYKSHLGKKHNWKQKQILRDFHRITLRNLENPVLKMQKNSMGGKSKSRKSK